MLRRACDVCVGARQNRGYLVSGVTSLQQSAFVQRRKVGLRRVEVRAAQGGRQRERQRLVDVIRLLPDYTRAYFRSPFRRALWGGIFLLGGFYVAQTINLSFGALGVNDVIAAAVCVLFTEYVTQYYRTRAKASFPAALLNNFKLGFTYGLFIDAFKLAS